MHVPGTMRLCSNRLFLLLCGFLLAAGPLTTFAQEPSPASPATAAPQTTPPQTTPPQPAPSQSAPAVIPSPQIPETQPPLDVDHDPILSPDAADNAAVNPSHPTASQEAKREHGVYTLTRNVDEVVLNCTVIDNEGHLVQDLAQTDFHIFEDNTLQNIVAF